MTDHPGGNHPPPWQGAAPHRPCPYCAEPVLVDAVVCRWCGRRLDRAPDSAARRFAPAAGLAIGGLLVAVSPVLPWVEVVLLGGVSLFDAAHLARSGSLPLLLLPLALLVCGVTAIIAALVLREGIAARVTAVVLLTVTGTIGGLLLTGLLTELPTALGLARIGVGPWIALAGALVMLIGALVPPPRTPVPAQAHATGRTAFSAAACGVVVVVAALGITALMAAGSSRDVAGPAAPEPSPQAAAPPPSSAIATTPPPSSSTADGGLADAEALVTAKGYRPYPDTAWEQPGGLQVLLGTVAESADGYANRAFFFYNGRYLGTDLATDSAGIREIWSTGDTVALSYEMYNADDAMCCPTADAATVRYHWTGNGVVPLDTVPSDDPAASPSRR